jgi:hypothetical protein
MPTQITLSKQREEKTHINSVVNLAHQSYRNPRQIQPLSIYLIFETLIPLLLHFSKLNQNQKSI